MKPFKAAELFAADLQSAYDYFRRGGSGAAEGFVERTERAMAQIIAQPLSCRLRASGWRQIRINRSSYAIFYREMPNHWFLAGVISLVRDPDLIHAQLLIREIRDSQQ